jgi:hypothetical protein
VKSEEKEAPRAGGFGRRLGVGEQEAGRKRRNRSVLSFYPIT